jgi:hypothetical protein
MVNNKIMVGLVVAILAVALIASTAIAGTSEAAKKSTINVYVKNIFQTKPGEKQKLLVCIRTDDPGCLRGFSKTVNLQNGDGRHGIQKVATFKIQLSNDPEDEFSITDISECGKLSHAIEFACGPEKKTGSNEYKSTIDYRELYENNRR